jgi:hypothetical protein
MKQNSQVTPRNANTFLPRPPEIQFKGQNKPIPEETYTLEIILPNPESSWRGLKAI